MGVERKVDCLPKSIQDAQFGLNLAFAPGMPMVFPRTMRNIPWSLCLLVSVAGTCLHGAEDTEKDNASGKPPPVRTVDGEMLVKWQGLYYFDIEKTPFNGRAISKHPNGKMSYDAELKGGRPHGRVSTFHENGRKQFEAHYTLGIQNGLETNWYSNGNRQLQVNFKDGRRHGKMTSWTREGVKDMEIYFVDGLKDGPINLFDETGRILSTQIYKNGRIAKPSAPQESTPEELGNLLVEGKFSTGEDAHPGFPQVDTETHTAILTHFNKTGASGWLWAREEFKPPFELTFEYLAKPRSSWSVSSKPSGMAVLFCKIQCPDTVPQTENNPGFMDDVSGFSLLFPTSGSKRGFRLLDAKGEVLQESKGEVTKSGGKWKKVQVRVQEEGIHAYFNDEAVFSLPSPDYSGTGGGLAIVATNGKLPCTHSIRNVTVKAWGENAPQPEPPEVPAPPPPPKLNPKIPTIGFAHIVRKKGLSYEDGKSAPFTGKAIDFYGNGQKKLEYNYRNGRQHGHSLFWYPNGQKAVHITYKKGVPVVEMKWSDGGEPLQ